MRRASDKKILISGNYSNQNSLMIRKSYVNLTKVTSGYHNPDQFIISRIIKSRAKRVLDVGCGNGDLLISLRKKGFDGDLVGLDLSNGIIKPGIKKNKEGKLGIRFFVGDAEKLPFKDESFDFIVLKWVFHHLPHPQKATNEAYRCLRGNGTILIAQPSKGDRPRFVECRRMIHRKYKLLLERAYTVAPSEEARKYLKKFGSIKEYHSRGYIDNPKMFPVYFATFRDFFEPPPNEKTWSRVTDDVRSFVSKRLAIEGRFIEKRKTGITIAKKIPKAIKR